MTPGRVFDLGSYQMEQDEMIDFATKFDPQYFHVDPDAAVDSPFGGLIASGWHTCSAWGRMWIDGVLSKADSHGSPGMIELRWTEPVRPSDVLTGTAEVLEARPSAKRSMRGSVLIRMLAYNQHGRVVMRAKVWGLFGRHQPAQPSASVVPGTYGRKPRRRRTPRVRIEARGLSLSLAMLGGSGPDLLICHATGFHAAAYRPLANHLKTRFRVWAVDFRGHGASDPAPDGDYGWKNMGAEVLACARHIGSSQLYGFGHSMGGATLLLAEQAEPQTFEALYLYEPIVPPRNYFSSRGENPLAGAARKRREVFASRAEVLQRYASRPPLNVLRADALAAYIDGGFVDLPDGRVKLACHPDTEARTFENSDSLTTDRLGGISVPTTVAAGTLPQFPNPAEFAPDIAASLAEAQLVSFASLGHFGPFEAPGVVAADMISRLTRPDDN